MLGMANSGNNDNGSQFFITYTALPDLDGKYTIFGVVESGFAVVDSIEKVETDEDDKPINDVLLDSIQILEN